MEEQVQYFKIANLIFSLPASMPAVLNNEEIKKIQDRFKAIVDSFVNYEITHQAAHGIKFASSKLPYNSMTAVGAVNDYIILHFAISYREPVLFVINTREGVAKNYISIEEAKGILNDTIYSVIQKELERPKNLDRMFANIENINAFIKDFQKQLENHANPDAITGTDCFEISLNDYEP